MPAVSQPNRLPAGGRIDRTSPVGFQFDGKRLQGFQGDTLASALLANDIHLIGRSFKYHRPRGIMTAGSEEPNALVQLNGGARTEPNIRATQAELYDGLTARVQNAWPSVKADIGALNGVFSRVLPSGFYYKTFMWPRSAWIRFYEPLIRRAAGLGVSPVENDPDTYEHRWAHCDVLIAGGGASGLAAALAAGRAGARVILADEQSEFGGYLLHDDAGIAGAPCAEWVANAVAELRAMETATLVPRGTVSGYYDHNFLTVLERVTDHLRPGDHPLGTPRQRLWYVRAKQVVLAQGALERPMVFRDNDRPGIMMASAIRSYVNRYGVIPGRRPVIFTNNDTAYTTAIDLARAGALVTIVDSRTGPTGVLPTAARDLGVEILAGRGIVRTSGGHRVSFVDVMQIDPSGGKAIGDVLTLQTDLVGMSSGWNPTVHLFSQSRGQLRFDESVSSFVPDVPFQPSRSAGACNGRFRLSDCLSEGFRAGAEAARDAGFGTGVIPNVPEVDAPDEGPLRDLWVIPSTAPVGHGGKHFVDFQNDVTAADIGLAAREGYVSVEHLKRYTTLGMGTDQGKTSNVNALGIMAEIRNIPIQRAGHTTFRPPYTPLTLGAVAGHNVGQNFDPIRRTPMYDWHAANGAVFEDVGQWKRPFYYPRPGETMQQAVNRECLAVRKGVGLLDASTLGKIDIKGPDAAEFLNRVYTNAWLKLGVGACRYGLMLNEHGMVIDDGVTTRLAEDHFHMTTTTGNAAKILTWLEEWLQTEWTGLRVHCTTVTEQWAVASLSGPSARDVLRTLTDLDLSANAMPFMTMREGRVAGIPARIFRISFTGESAFEINVPARYGHALWEALMAAGTPHGITPFGTEAMHVLRAERGFIIVGQETDGTVTPGDLGMDWAVSRTKPDFLGKRSLSRSDTARMDRKQLVGLLPQDPRTVLKIGEHAVEGQTDRPPMQMIGHVTSSYWSPTLERGFALAMIREGRDRIGGSVTIARMDGSTLQAKVVEPVFYDKTGERARA